jgi:uncharacterized protein involved in exopolysaccharide biosynthesis
MIRLLRPALPYWRVAVVGLLGALIAFGCSFMVEPAYSSKTRLLIRGRDATFLTSSAADLSKQPGIIDASMADTVGSTQSGLATSREVAERVVDELHLDTNRPEESGIVAWLARTSAAVYGRVRAIVTFGFYDEGDPRENAIATVQGSVVAATLEKSYVLELQGSAETPALARDITNAAARHLVELSAERSKAESARYAGYLEQQLARATADVDAASKAIGEYKATHNISDLDEQLVQDAVSIEQLRTQIDRNKVDLEGKRAQLATINSSLAGVSPTESNRQQIRTGRSETAIDTEAPSSLHQELTAQRDSLAAEVADLEAKQRALEERLGSTSTAELTGAQVDLRALEQQLALAKDTQTELNKQRRDALLNANNDRSELTRVDSASLPVYPDSPRRYLYLALGLVLGALAGGGLTYLARRDQLGTPETTGDDEDIDLSDVERQHLAEAAARRRALGERPRPEPSGPSRRPPVPVAGESSGTTDHHGETRAPRR